MFGFIKKYLNKRKSNKISAEIITCYRYANKILDKTYSAKQRIFKAEEYYLMVLKSSERNFLLNPFVLKHAEKTYVQEHAFQVDFIGSLNEVLSTVENRIEHLNAELKSLEL